MKRNKWLHKKTGRYYEVLYGINIQMWQGAPGIKFTLEFDGKTFIEKDMIPAVVYQSLKDEKVWVRPFTEFMDGRFEQVPIDE